MSIIETKCQHFSFANDKGYIFVEILMKREVGRFVICKKKHDLVSKQLNMITIELNAFDLWNISEQGLDSWFAYTKLISFQWC